MADSRWGVGFVLLLAACGSTPVPQAVVDQEERRLLQPFLDGGEVGCGELHVDMTANFHQEVGQPTVDARLHSAVKQPGPGYVETVWTNRVGDLAGAFVVAIGEPDSWTDKGLVRGRHTKFTVLHQVRFRVYEGTRAMTLDVEAKGRPLVAREAAAGRERDLAEYRVHDGVLHRR